MNLGYWKDQTPHVWAGNKKILPHEVRKDFCANLVRYLLLFELGINDLLKPL